jgi:predicted PurR-regulated permease PerM
MKPNSTSVSYVLAAAAVYVTLQFHLLPAVFAGLAVHVLTVKLAGRLPKTWSEWAHGIALAAIVTIVILGLTGAALGVAAFISGSGGMAALLDAAAGTLGKLRHMLPQPVADAVPASMDELQAQLASVLRTHGRNLSAMGVAGARTFAHVLIGMVIGGMTALHRFRSSEALPPLASALHARAQALADVFDKVVFAQVRISAVNTFFTAVYLLVVLPLCGVQMPLVPVLIILTFVAGLLPIIGNLISNTAIVLISLGISPKVALGSVIFLAAIHKLEYFTNAKIIGGRLEATAWELLCAMLAMEALFGVPGLVAAPVVYAWLKEELKARVLV